MVSVLLDFYSVWLAENWSHEIAVENGQLTLLTRFLTNENKTLSLQKYAPASARAYSPHQFEMNSHNYSDSTSMS
jgi:hypothetical protein